MRAILIATILAMGAAAQPTEPAPLIQLTRRPGLDSSFIRRYADAKAAVNVVGIASITGAPETWLLALHDSFAGIEDADKLLRQFSPSDPPDQLPGDVFAMSRSLIALYRPGLSYRPDQAIRLFSKARYIHATVYRIRPGAEAAFTEVVKQRRGALDSINVDRPDMAYQVISGASSGTYLILAPLASLKSLDDGIAKAPVSSTAVSESEISRVHLLFRVEPGMSYVSDDFASSDAEFWRSNSR